MERLEADGHRLRGEIARYEDFCDLCCAVGPESLLVMLVERLRAREAPARISQARVCGLQRALTRQRGRTA